MRKPALVILTGAMVAVLATGSHAGSKIQKGTLLHLADGDVQGHTKRPHARVPRHPVRGSADRRSALASAGTGDPTAEGPRGKCVRAGLRPARVPAELAERER